MSEKTTEQEVKKEAPQQEIPITPEQALQNFATVLNHESLKLSKPEHIALEKSLITLHQVVEYLKGLTPAPKAKTTPVRGTNKTAPKKKRK